MTCTARVRLSKTRPTPSAAPRKRKPRPKVPVPPPRPPKSVRSPSSADTALRRQKTQGTLSVLCVFWCFVAAQALSSNRRHTLGKRVRRARARDLEPDARRRPVQRSHGLHELVDDGVIDQIRAVQNGPVLTAG